MVLEFEINNQIIKRKDIFTPVANSENYLYIHFNFSEDWEGLEKIITFERESDVISLYLDINNSCVVPKIINKHSGFFISLNGVNKEKQVLITTNKYFINIIDSGQTQFFETYIKNINTETLEYEKNGDVAYLEIPNIYGTKLKLIKEKGIIQLLGRNNENDEEIVLNEIDLPTEKIITNIYYDTEKESLIFQFENNADIEVAIGDIFELDNYYTISQINELLSDLKQELINYTNEKENALESQINAIIDDISNKDEEYKESFNQINSNIENVSNTLNSQIEETNTNLTNLDNKLEGYNENINNEISSIKTDLQTTNEEVSNIKTILELTSEDILNIESEVYVS